MLYTPPVIDELNILARYDLGSTQHGIKIHSSADPQVIAAARRLFDKGLISQADGGYLTALGLHAAEHAQKLLQIINP
jgi:uncharacterized protein (TIGR02647 family)